MENEIGKKRSIELGLIEHSYYHQCKDSKSTMDFCYYDSDVIHKILANGYAMIQASKSDIWHEADRFNICSPSIMRTALLIGDRPAKQDTAEDILKALIKYIDEAGIIEYRASKAPEMGPLSILMRRAKNILK